MWIKITSNKWQFTNEEWPDISEEELKHFLEEYGKISSIKTWRNMFLGRNEALLCYGTAEEAKTALADKKKCIKDGQQSRTTLLSKMSKLK